MSFKQKGQIIQINDTEQINDTFSKRVFVIQDNDDNYSNIYAFEVVKDKTALLDKFKEGEEVEVSFNIRCREWNKSYYTNLQAWRIESMETAPTQAKQVEPPKVETDDGGGLPF